MSAKQFGFNELQNALINWPKFDFENYTAVNNSLFARILQILDDSRSSSLKKYDIQPLFRQLLLSETASSGEITNLRVPNHHLWPSGTEWSDHGVTAMDINDGTFLLSASSWFPNWLGTREFGVFSDSFSNKKVRVSGECKADPFISDVTGYQNYSSPGQREAIRAAFLIPPGETLIVNLPTGSGKSLVAQAPSLVNHQEGNLTIFVVPTVALSIDQERQMRKYFRDSHNISLTIPLAWYSGISEEVKQQIKSNLRSGKQRILFVSPESLTTSLLRTVFDITRNGMLRYLVVDEAHLITQWGDGFRPAFQLLSGLRNSLLKLTKEEGVDSFRTLLLSATFTPETIETLADLFGPPEMVQMVTANHLRPEPQYWFSSTRSFEEKKERIKEAIKHAPRPFILYVTKKKDAVEWYEILKQEVGYKRIGLFNGDTNGQDRRKIIDDWIQNKLDGIVATSAFGVGIDKSDIRTVIHATIPETLDRFYQEVGRGGRDGCVSNSLMVYQESDWELSKKMANPILIGNELGFAKWMAMFESRNQYGTQTDDLFRINPEAVRHGLTGSNDEDVRWNMRTLSLMTRAKFLELHIKPNEFTDGVVEEDESLSIISALSSMLVFLKRHDHLLMDKWESDVSFSRNKTLAAGNRNLKLMKGMLEERREVSDVLSELYTNYSERWPVTVTKICGGCPVDRFGIGKIDAYHVPIARPIYNTKNVNISKWSAIFPHINPAQLNVFYDPDQDRNDLIKLFQWLVREIGVQEICADEGSDLTKLPAWHLLYKQSESKILIHRELKQLCEEPYTPLARVTFFDSRVTSSQIRSALIIIRPVHLVFYPSQTIDFNHKTRLLSDSLSNSVKFKQIFSVIKQ